MFDSKEEILEKIGLGEDSLIEFKSVRFAGPKIRGPERDDLADELAAFANRKEGVLLLGVDDKTRQVEGIPVDKLDMVESLVREVCNDAIKPPLVTSIVRMMLPDTSGAERAVIMGSLDMQIIEACRFVARNARVGARKGMGRIDQPQFDMTAVFEAVVNAAAHRDYSIYGSKIRLQLFSDRLVIRSPGSLPNTMTVESMAYRQAARNEVITSLLARCRIPDEAWLATDRSTMMDKRGEGVPIIMESSKKLSGKEPIYRSIDDAELELTIFAASQAPGVSS